MGQDLRVPIQDTKTEKNRTPSAAATQHNGAQHPAIDEDGYIGSSIYPPFPPAPPPPRSSTNPYNIDHPPYLNILDPKNLRAAITYPDATEWALAHDAELDNLDSTNTVKWLHDSDIPPHTKLIPLKMTYKYKRHPNGTQAIRKCTVRGDMMVPSVHYDPDQTTTYMAEKTSVRLLLSLCAAQNWVIEHFDITSA